MLNHAEILKTITRFSSSLYVIILLRYEFTLFKEVANKGFVFFPIIVFIKDKYID
jgi:hypothetical protein